MAPSSASNVEARMRWLTPAIRSPFPMRKNFSISISSANFASVSPLTSSAHVTELAFVEFGISTIEEIGGDAGQHRIAQELQPLVALLPFARPLINKGTMRQRHLQQGCIPKAQG